LVLDFTPQPVPSNAPSPTVELPEMALLVSI
jgi:hypothetical protein